MNSISDQETVKRAIVTLKTIDGEQQWDRLDSKRTKTTDIFRSLVQRDDWVEMRAYLKLNRRMKDEIRMITLMRTRAGLLNCDRKLRHLTEDASCRL